MKNIVSGYHNLVIAFVFCLGILPYESTIASVSMTSRFLATSHVEVPDYDVTQGDIPQNILSNASNDDTEEGVQEDPEERLFSQYRVGEGTGELLCWKSPMVQSGRNACDVVTCAKRLYFLP